MLNKKDLGNRDDRDLVEGGNNDTPSKPARRQSSQLCKYVFTKFLDWTDNRDGETRVKEFEESLQKICKSYFFGRELCTNTKRPHLQGYMVLTRRMRISQIIKYKDLKMHLKGALGDEEANLSYTSKEKRGFTKWEKPKAKTHDIIKKYFPTIEDACTELLRLGKERNSLYNTTQEKLNIFLQCGTEEIVYKYIIGCIDSEIYARKNHNSFLREYNLA